MQSMASGTIGIEVPTAASIPATSAEPNAGRHINLFPAAFPAMFPEPETSGCVTPNALRSFSIGSAGGCTSSGVPGGRGSVAGAVGGRTGTLICGARQFGQNGCPSSTIVPHWLQACSTGENLTVRLPGRKCRTRRQRVETSRLRGRGGLLPRRSFRTGPRRKRRNPESAALNPPALKIGRLSNRQTLKPAPASSKCLTYPAATSYPFGLETP